jgi:hypothetical protein
VGIGNIGQPYYTAGGGLFNSGINGKGLRICPDRRREMLGTAEMVARWNSREFAREGIDQGDPDRMRIDEAGAMC